MEVREIEERRARAQEALDGLGRFIGVLHAARLTALIWTHQAENPAYRYPKQYGLQLTFLGAALTLRKLQDFWRTHLADLLPAGSLELAEARWVIDETQTRSVRRVANQLLAHYSENVRGLLLSEAELAELYRATGWERDEDLAETLGQMLERLLDLHAALRRIYGLDSENGRDVAAG